jgi:general stress protein 26
MTDDLERLYELAKDIEVAMMTTRGPDGHLQSRPMATQKRAAGADLWFVTADGTPKLQDLGRDPHVNLAYFNSRTAEWISVSGIATISRDRQKIRELYAPGWKTWFSEQGDPQHGTPDDPRMVLIGVTVHAAEFLEVNKPRPVIVYEIVKGWISGNEPELGEIHHVGPRETRLDA